MPTPERPDAQSHLLHVLEEAVSRRTARVPPYPTTAMQLQAVLARDDYEIEALVEAMRTDPAFTGNLLRLANSPLYRRGNEVTSVASAVMRVGARELTRLAMAAAVSRTTLDGTLMPLRRRAWRESLASAMISERLAPLSHLEPGEAFVAGLLHDVGKALALSVLEEALAQRPDLEVDEPMLWQLVDATHVAFGTLVAERWQLPGVLGAVISTHHDSHEQQAPLTALVLKADAAVALLEGHRQVTAAMLEALGSNPEEARVLEAMLPTVPVFLSSLEVEGSGSPASAPVSPARKPHRDWLCVEPVGAPRVEAWPVRHFEPHFAEATVPRALETGQLIELRLTPMNLKFWALIERSEAHGGSWFVMFKPFALSEEAARAWDAVVTERRAAA